MNVVTLIGRLVRDPLIRYSQTQDGQMAVAHYVLAVDRRFSRGEQTADFINCTVFGKQAEFAEKYLKQGMKVGVVGRISTGSYTDKNGNKVYTFEVVVDSHDFCESKNAGNSNGYSGNNPSGNQAPPKPNDTGFMQIPDGIEDDLPFK